MMSVIEIFRQFGVQHGRSGITQECDRTHIAKVRENVTFRGYLFALQHEFSRRGPEQGFAQGVVMTLRPAVRVLLVDDYEPFRQSVRSMLSKAPELQVIGEVSDGLEAVQRAEELQPDLILLDIGLPKLNGLEAASRIGRVAPSSKIIFVTSESGSDVVHAALSNGARGYVLKSDAGSELLRALETVLGGGRFVSRGVEDCDLILPGSTSDFLSVANIN
jgi:CheY-like chemotaxis protein